MARVSGFWKKIGTAIEPAFQGGADLLLRGVNRYLNFGDDSGEAGYGIRDNGGVLQYKNSAGAWTNFNAGGGGGGGGHVIEDEGTPLTQRTNLNFVGAGVAVTDDGPNDATVVTIPGGASIPDGDKGDITVSTGGTVWTIDTDAVTTGKIANQAVTRSKLEYTQSGHFLGRHAAGTGDVQEVSSAQARTILSIDNVDNTSDLNKPISTATQTALDAKLDDSQKGVANGLAELDGTGRVPTSQLPSFIDDVVEAANFAALPVTGETGKIYVTLDNNLTYRWSGTAYVEISASLALGETSATAYRGDRGKIAYDHSQIITGNPHGTTKADIGLGSVDNVSADSLRDRATHTGTQTASTISDFAATVIATVLTGFAAAGTRTAIVATDSILVAFGKVQKYFNDLAAIAFSGALSDATGTINDTQHGTRAGGTLHANATTSVAGFMSSADKTKLDGIATGAEVNVNADWNAVSGDAQILNKPTIPTQYTDELAQDAVGTILTDTTSIDLIYDDAGNTISAQREALTGDVTAPKNSNTTTLATVNSNVGSFGLAGSVAQFTVNAKGLITAAANVAISITASAVSDFAATVRATVLTGLSTATSTAVTATDSILVAIGKLQAQNTAQDAAIALNTAKVTNATHTGEVTGSGALTVDKTAITNKTLVTAAVGDQILIADASDTDNLKRVTVQTIIDLATASADTSFERLDFQVQTAPATPSADTVTVYMTGSGTSPNRVLEWKMKNEDGEEIILATLIT